MELHNFEELIDLLSAQPEMPRMAVAAAEDEVVIDAALEAENRHYATPIWIGDGVQIRKIISAKGIDSERYQIISTENARESGIEAVRLVREGKADFIMKGLMETREILGPVVDKQNGIGTGRVMSHVALTQLPNYHKLLLNTDGGMNIEPNLEQKASILHNAVDALHAIGYDCPKIAVLAAVETVNPKMKETVEATALKEMAANGDFGKCVVEGPISYDLTMSADIAKHKRFSCDYCGNFDGVLVPNIVCGNILGKSWIITGGGKMAGIVVGAKVPIVLTSRGSSMEEKTNSIAFAALMMCSKSDKN